MAFFSPFAASRKILILKEENISSDVESIKTQSIKEQVDESNENDEINELIEENINEDFNCDNDEPLIPITEEELWIQKELMMIDNEKINEFRKQELEIPRLNQTFVFNNKKDNYHKNNDKKEENSSKILNRSLDSLKIKKIHKNPSIETQLILLKQNLNKISIHNELSESIKMHKKYSSLFNELDKKAEEIRLIIKNSPFH